MRTVAKQAAALRRPGIGSLVVLVVAAVLPPPSATGASAHLLGIPTLCPLRAATGIACPGCGITRALCLCAHGRFFEAVTLYHPVVPLVFAGLVAAAGYGLTTGKPLPERFGERYWYGTVAVLLAVWVARMCRLLPFPPL